MMGSFGLLMCGCFSINLVCSTCQTRGLFFVNIDTRLTPSLFLLLGLRISSLGYGCIGYFIHCWFVEFGYCSSLYSLCLVWLRQNHHYFMIVAVVVVLKAVSLLLNGSPLISSIEWQSLFSRSIFVWSFIIGKTQSNDVRGLSPYVIQLAPKLCC